jgi:GTP-binding protein
MHTHTARFLAGAADPRRLPKSMHPEIAFAGRSNVGKSSLLNRLVGHRALARVSKTPGRTQQINFFLVDERVVFVDLPGYGFARVPLAVKDEWKELVERYLERRKHLRAVVVLIDLRRGMQADDIGLLEYLAARHIPALVVATKADKLAHAERQRCSQALANGLVTRAVAVVTCSASSGEGMARLWQELERAYLQS